MSQFAGRRAAPFLVFAEGPPAWLSQPSGPGACRYAGGRNLDSREGSAASLESVLSGAADAAPASAAASAVLLALRGVPAVTEQHTALQTTHVVSGAHTSSRRSTVSSMVSAISDESNGSSRFSTAVYEAPSLTTRGGASAGVTLDVTGGGVSGFSTVGGGVGGGSTDCPVRNGCLPPGGSLDCLKVTTSSSRRSPSLSAAKSASFEVPFSELHHFSCDKERVFSDMRGKRIFIFLDYDGTLTPIISDPRLAFLPPETRDILVRLATASTDSLDSIAAASEATASSSLDREVADDDYDGLLLVPPEGHPCPPPLLLGQAKPHAAPPMHHRPGGRSGSISSLGGPLRRSVTVGIVTGRAMSSVRRFVGIPPSEGVRLLYAASHGFHIHASGEQLQHRVGPRYIPALREAAVRVAEGLGHLAGTVLEDNEFSVSVHYRNGPVDCEAEVEAVVESVIRQYPVLKATRGKKVFELRINVPWDKGRAVLWLLDAMNIDPRDSDTRLVYIGDDQTDEDAFRVLRRFPAAVPLLVASEDDSTPNRMSAAVATLRDPTDVKNFLVDLYQSVIV